LGRLRGLLDRVVAGEPAVVLIAGEAGVGKSRLALGRDDSRELRQALALLPEEPATKTQAVVLGALAASLMRIGEAEQCLDIVQRAIEVAASVGAQEADALITLGVTLAFTNSPDTGVVSADAGGVQAGLAALRQGLTLAERHELHGVALRG
jgi:hypothetical protein